MGLDILKLLNVLDVFSGPLGPQLGKLGVLFNDYVNAFVALTQETDKDFIIDAGSVKYFLYGSDARKQAAWKKAHPGSLDSIYFVVVSSYPVEIWGDLREVKSGPNKGGLVVNNLSLGHELIHGLRTIMSGWTSQNEDQGALLSPDKYAVLK